MSNKIVIIGAAESGVGAAILAKQQGYDVFVTDGGIIKPQFKEELVKYQIRFEQETHSMQEIDNASLVIKSPGIPHKAAVVQYAISLQKELISEIEFAYRFKGTSKIIAITGSNGKTTTTSLIYHIYKTAALNVAVCGNIGFSFAKQIAVAPAEYYVVEISSFQLDDISTFKPDVAIITNITEDHLDRYNYQFENYIQAKFNIIKNLTESDAFIYCADDEVTMKYINTYPITAKKYPISMSQSFDIGAFIKAGKFNMNKPNEHIEMNVNEFTLKGKHNQYNTMAAAVASYVMDIRKEKIRDALQTFKSIEHRLESVAFIKGVEYINDSKATNVNSTWYALESMDKPTILILGGVDKGNDYTILAELVKEKVKAIVCLGVDNRKIHEAFGNYVELIVNTTSAEQAAQAAYHFATSGDAVLLSPACASFDLFDNYEDRGNQFKKAVKNL
jgi:UDP-N-acetylmuramoylalanine--D-glutamate ligase